MKVHSTLTDFGARMKQMPEEIIRGFRDSLKKEGQEPLDHEGSWMITEGSLVDEVRELFEASS